MSTRPGYFKVSMDAARNLVESSQGPELLAGYITLCSFRYGSGRRLTAAGAKSIRKATGCTDWRSKRVMDDLRALRFGEKGENPLLTKTGRPKGNAAEYELHEWDGSHAYVPALLVDAGLKRLCAGADRETCRDALLVLLYLYANTDYAGWMGAPPDYFAYQQWETDGLRWAGDAELELGHAGTVGRNEVWLVALPAEDTWLMPHRLCRDIFGTDAEAVTEQFWCALWFLLDSGTVCKVGVVTTGNEQYPLWVFNRTLRESLNEHHGIHADLATHVHRLALSADFDPDNLLMRAAVGDDRESSGTGLFFCVGPQVCGVHTLLIPMFHAPTPINLDGLKEVAVTTQGIAATIGRLRKKVREAA